MKVISQLIDFSVWTGHWPFTRQRYTQLEQLKIKLQSLGITQAFVAPTEAILEQDPIYANKRLLETVCDEYFSPVPVIDLSYANWDENLALAAADERVRIVKLLPNYHNFELDEKRLEPLVAWTVKHNLIISIQMRVEDMRGQHPLMLIHDLEVIKMVKSMAFFPEQRFILSNLYIHELPEALFSLDHVWVDISSLEHVDLIKQLAKNEKFDHMLFASHSPFYFPEAALNKLNYTDASQEHVDKVAFLNAQTLLRRKG